MSEPITHHKRCISCGKVFHHTHPGVIKGIYWACCEGCNTNDDKTTEKDRCCMCEREIAPHMKPVFLPNGEDRIWFCGSYCSSAYARGQAGWTICDQVANDINKRRLMGTNKYGKPLDWDDGKDYLYEAYEEALDQCIYLKAALVKRDSHAGRKPGDGGLFAGTGNDGAPVPVVRNIHRGD